MSAAASPEVSSEYMYLLENVRQLYRTGWGEQIRSDTDARRQRTLLVGLQDYFNIKRRYAYSILAITAAELLIVNGLFGYFLASNHWHASSAVLDVWLGATIVQVFGVVVVVTHHLFPTSHDALASLMHPSVSFEPVATVPPTVAPTVRVDPSSRTSVKRTGKKFKATAG